MTARIIHGTGYDANGLEVTRADVIHDEPTDRRDPCCQDRSCVWCEYDRDRAERRAG